MIESNTLAAGTAGRACRKPSLPDEIDLDLRHDRDHSRNSADISVLVAHTPSRNAAAAGRQIAHTLERRICLKAQISDVLFGLTPATLQERLRSLSEALAELLADPDQVIRVEVVCRDACPAALHYVILRSLQELIGETVKHGFYARLVGRVRVDLVSSPRGTELVVADDGWDLRHRQDDTQGLRLVRSLIAPFGGTLTLQSGDGVGAEIFLPSARSSGQSAFAQSR